ncbi:hypothetical protein EDB85DRAFT_470955 [Lactarius pseudohatsudake]|nr:hypothetical protein EDB85DRAFT_470955 [Lactarius pseudohatsudake]
MVTRCACCTVHVDWYYIHSFIFAQGNARAACLGNGSSSRFSASSALESKPNLGPLLGPVQGSERVVSEPASSGKPQTLQYSVFRSFDDNRNKKSSWSVLLSHAAPSCVTAVVFTAFVVMIVTTGVVVSSQLFCHWCSGGDWRRALLGAASSLLRLSVIAVVGVVGGACGLELCWLTAMMVEISAARRSFSEWSAAVVVGGPRTLGLRWRHPGCSSSSPWF